MKVTVIKDVFARDLFKHNEIDMDFNSLKELVSKPRLTSVKNNAPYLFPFNFTYWEKGERCYACNSNAVNYTMLIFDVDGGITIDEFIEAHKEFQFVLYTTFSHTEEHHKFRALFPIVSPLSFKSFDAPYFKKWFLEKFTYQDPAVMKFIGFYTPNTKNLNTYRSHVNEGKVFNFTDYLHELKPYKNHYLMAERFREALDERAEKNAAKWGFESSSVATNIKVLAYLKAPVSPKGMGSLSFTAMAVANAAGDADTVKKIQAKMRLDKFSEKEIERTTERAGRGR